MFKPAANPIFSLFQITWKLQVVAKAAILEREGGSEQLSTTMRLGTSFRSARMFCSSVESGL